MHAMQTQDLELAPITSRPADDTRDVRAAFPIHRGGGAESTSAVYFELAPGMRLGAHTDSAEEVLVVLEGEVEAIVRDERTRISAGGFAVVPANAPHDVRNAGEGTARVLGLFSSGAMIAEFEDEFSVAGGEPTRY